jgi:hypothetical protein
LKILSIEAGPVSETQFDVHNGVDVGMALTMEDGSIVEGRVTLVPSRDSCGWETFGVGPECWCDKRLLSAAHKTEDFHNTIHKIANEACAEAESQS